MAYNLLFIAPSYDIGGAQKIASFVADGCLKKGYQVSFLALDKGKDLLRLDSRINRLYIEKRNSLLSKIAQVFKLKKMVLKLNPDGIVVFGNIKTALLALSKTKTPILWSERGDFGFYKFLHRKLILNAYKNADFLVFQTEMARDQYPKFVLKKSVVIPNPCFLASKRIIQEKSFERKKRVVSVGRFAFEKRFDVLINSFVKIHPYFPEYELLLFGDGPLKGEYETMIANNQAETFVHLPGKIQNIEDYIYDSSLFVLSSQHEGIPNTLLEAMSLGVPIVATDCSPGGARFLTKNGTIGGPVVPIGDIDKMADAISFMLKHRDEAERLASLGMSVRFEFAPDRIIDLWLNAIQTLLKHTKQ